MASNFQGPVYRVGALRRRSQQWGVVDGGELQLFRSQQDAEGSRAPHTTIDLAAVALERSTAGTPGVTLVAQSGERQQLELDALAERERWFSRLQQAQLAHVVDRAPAGVDVSDLPASILQTVADRAASSGAELDESWSATLGAVVRVQAVARGLLTRLRQHRARRREMLALIAEAEALENDKRSRTRERRRSATHQRLAERRALLRRERDWLLFRQDMIDGVEVVKHGRRGRPHVRRLRCDATWSRLVWHADWAPRAFDEGVPLAALVDVLPGAEAPAFRRARRAPGFSPDRCLSLVFDPARGARRRTLDLETTDRAHRDYLVSGLRLSVDGRDVSAAPSVDVLDRVLLTGSAAHGAKAVAVAAAAAALPVPPSPRSARKADVATRAVRRFNQDPAAGVDFARANGLCPTAAALGDWLRETPSLNRALVGAYVSGAGRDASEHRLAFVDTFRFAGRDVEPCLRELLGCLELPAGDAQAEDRVLGAFARAYADANPGGAYGAPGDVLTVALAMRNLQASLQQDAGAERMSLPAFKRVLRDALPDADAATRLYESLLASPMLPQPADDGDGDMLTRVAHRGPLERRVSRSRGWKRRHAALSGSWLFLFAGGDAHEHEVAVDLRGTVVELQAAPSRVFVVSSPRGQPLTILDAGASGLTELSLRAGTAGEAKEWVEMLSSAV